MKIVSNLFQPTLLSLSTQYYIGEQGMCMFCGLGFYPWMALSTCNHTHEDQNDAASQGSRAIEILKERYAKGEITKEQFMEMRKTIEQ